MFPEDLRFSYTSHRAVGRMAEAHPLPPGPAGEKSLEVLSSEGGQVYIQSREILRLVSDVGEAACVQ